MEAGLRIKKLLKEKISFARSQPKINCLMRKLAWPLRAGLASLRCGSPLVH